MGPKLRHVGFIFGRFGTLGRLQGNFFWVCVFVTPGRPLVPYFGHRFCRRASNIDFCRTSLAIVKVLGGQGNHFWTILGPIWDQDGTMLGQFSDDLAPLGACSVVFFDFVFFLYPQVALWCSTLATGSAEGLQTSIFVDLPCNCQGFEWPREPFWNKPSLQPPQPSTNQAFNQPTFQPTKPSTNQAFN